MIGGKAFANMLLLALASMVSAPTALAAPGILARPEMELNLQGFTSKISGLAFSPDGRWLAASGDKLVRIWDVTKGELVATLRGQSEIDSFGTCADLAFSPDGRQLVVIVNSPTGVAALRVYSVSDFSEVSGTFDAPVPEEPIERIAFSPDGKYLVEQAVCAVAPDSNGLLPERITLLDWPNRRVIASKKVPAESSKRSWRFLGFAFGDDVVAVAGGNALFRTPGLSPVDLSSVRPSIRPIVESFVTGKRMFDPSRPNSNWNWISSGLTIFRFDRDLAVAVGTTVDDNGRNHSVAVTSLSTKETVALYQRHRMAVTAVTISDDGSLVATGDALGDVHVWETRTGAPLVLLPPGLPAAPVVPTPARVASGPVAPAPRAIPDEHSRACIGKQRFLFEAAGTVALSLGFDDTGTELNGTVISVTSLLASG